MLFLKIFIIFAYTKNNIFILFTSVKDY